MMYNTSKALVSTLSIVIRTMIVTYYEGRRYCVVPTPRTRVIIVIIYVMLAIILVNCGFMPCVMWRLYYRDKSSKWKVLIIEDVRGVAEGGIDVLTLVKLREEQYKNIGNTWKQKKVHICVCPSPYIVCVCV